ncbi:hypothetical protein [Streptomyces dioscori]|uniref:hypothetical protein n=1 Tax=Streptomyces dioscori TaxID=2109333 RepID=UPI00131D8134|nr:hypothetical protein [Streptomyces dioscori]
MSIALWDKIHHFPHHFLKSHPLPGGIRQLSVISADHEHTSRGPIPPGLTEGAKGISRRVSGRVVAGDGRALIVIERRPDTLT